MAFYHTDRDEAKHWPAWWQVAGAAWQIFSDLEPMTCNLRLAAKCFVKLEVVSVILRLGEGHLRRTHVQVSPPGNIEILRRASG